MADEEALLVVIGVDEPGSDAFHVVGADFAGGGVEDVDAVDLDLDLAAGRIEDFHVWFAEDDEEVALAGVLQVLGHVQVGVHAGFQDGERAKAIEVGRLGVEIEGAGDQYVEAGVRCLAGGSRDLAACQRAKFRADQDRRAFFHRAAIGIAAFGGDVIAGPGG